MTDFITYKQPKQAVITDVNDSMHCYAEFDFVNIVAEFIEDGQKWFVAEQNGTDYQQQISAEEFTLEIDLNKYIGKDGDVCSEEQTSSPAIIHFIPEGSVVRVVKIKNHKHFLADVYFQAERMYQTIDIRDLTFNI